MNLNSILKIKVPERNESEFKPLKAMHCKAHIQIHDQPNVHQKDQANIKIWEQPEHRHRMWYLNLDSSLPMWAPPWEAYIWIQTSPRIVGNHTTTEVKSEFKPLWNQVSFRSLMMMVVMVVVVGGGGGGREGGVPPFAWKITWCPWAAPGILAKARRLQLADASFRE